MADHKLENILKELKQYKLEQEQVLDQLAQVEKPLWVQVGDKKKLLRIDDIAFITTNSKGLDFYTTDGNQYINFDSISNVDKDFERDLRLMKTHRSFIVNLNQIDTVQTVSGGRKLTFKGLPEDKTALVTYNYLDELKKRLGALDDDSDSD